MSNRLSGGLSPLGYLGTNASTPPNTTIVDRAPTTTDYKNRALGDLWLYINKSVSPYTTAVYILSSLYGNEADWVQLSTGLNELKDLTGDAGGAVGADGAQNINIVGTGGVTVTGTPLTNTLTIGSSLGGWTEVTGATQAMATNNGYIANWGAGVTFTLPAVSVVGDEVRVAVKNAGGAVIAQNAGQTIHFGTDDTTTGVAGSLTSTAQYDIVTMICITANSDWQVISSIGNWTVA